MNGTQLKTELEQCLSWAEYANDFECFEFFDAKIAPLDSEYFTVNQIEALHNYACEFSINFDSFFSHVDYGCAIVWLDNNSSYIGTGATLLEAANDLLGKIVQWNNQNETTTLQL